MAHVILGDLYSTEVQRTPKLCRCELYTVIQVQRTVTKGITCRYFGAMHPRFTGQASLPLIPAVLQIFSVRCTSAPAIRDKLYGASFAICLL